MARIKGRLDMLVHERGLSDSREGAKRLIIAGLVRVDGVLRDKPGEPIPAESVIEVEGPAMPYVSRGGLKLEKAINAFGLDLTGRVAIDVGASTGGFTDCMLKHGAAKVYAVDVGYGQLAYKLREDVRVVTMERTNARYLEPSDFEPGISFASMDLSFISFMKVLPAVLSVCSEELSCVVLVKPQFEAGRGKVGKNGVVREPEVHLQVLKDAADGAESLGLKVAGLTYSPIKGPEGNIEYLMLVGKPGSGLDGLADVDMAAKLTVSESHESL